MTKVCLLDDRLPPSQLGDGIHWDQRSMSLYWVDIDGHSIHRYELDTRQHVSWTVSKQVTFAYPRGDHLVLCMADGVYRFNPVTGVEEPIVRLDLPKGHRLNDGKLDPNGRLWVGNQHYDGSGQDRSALRSAGRRSRRGRKRVYQREWQSVEPRRSTGVPRGHEPRYDLGIRLRSPNRISIQQACFASLGDGNPDGLGIDAEGNIIAAIFGGNCVRIFSPWGDLLGHVNLPVPNPISCVIVGSTLYITTAFDGMSHEERRVPTLRSCFRSPHLGQRCMERAGDEILRPPNRSDHDFTTGHRNDGARHVATEARCEKDVGACKFCWLACSADKRLLTELGGFLRWHR